MTSHSIPTKAIQAAHAAICEQNLDYCLDPDWRGKCVKAVEDAAPIIWAQAWEAAVVEGAACGWLHDYAADDLRNRNPYQERGRK